MVTWTWSGDAASPDSRPVSPAAGRRSCPVPEAAGKRAQVVLTLVRVDAGTTLDSLTSWSHDAVLFVATGGSSAERLRTVSEQFRASGVNLRFAVLVGADATDVSSGRETPARIDGGAGRGTAS